MRNYFLDIADEKNKKPEITIDENVLPPSGTPIGFTFTVNIPDMPDIPEDAIQVPIDVGAAFPAHLPSKAEFKHPTVTTGNSYPTGYVRSNHVHKGLYSSKKR